MGGACGKIKKDGAKKDHPKRVVIRNRNITVNKDMNQFREANLMDGIINQPSLGSPEIDLEIDFDAHVGV